MSTTRIRPVGEDDLEAARRLLHDAVPLPAQLEVLLPVLESAARAPGDEQRGLAAEANGRVVAVVVFGEYAGASGAGRLHLLAVHRDHRRRGIGSLLFGDALSQLGARGARFILAELPEERPALDDYFAFLRSRGFVEESRIPDFHREGVALMVLKRPTRDGGRV